MISRLRNVAYSDAQEQDLGGGVDADPEHDADEEHVPGLGGGTRQITAAQRAAFRADLRYWHTAIVVLSPYAPHYADLRNALNQLTGEPARQVQGVLLWDVGK